MFSNWRALDDSAIFRETPRGELMIPKAQYTLVKTTFDITIIFAVKSTASEDEKISYKLIYLTYQLAINLLLFPSSSSSTFFAASLPSTGTFSTVFALSSSFVLNDEGTYFGSSKSGRAR